MKHLLIVTALMVPIMGHAEYVNCHQKEDEAAIAHVNKLLKAADKDLILSCRINHNRFNDSASSSTSQFIVVDVSTPGINEIRRPFSIVGGGTPGIHEIRLRKLPYSKQFYNEQNEKFNEHNELFLKDNPGWEKEFIKPDELLKEPLLNMRFLENRSRMYK